MPKANSSVTKNNLIQLLEFISTQKKSSDPKITILNSFLMQNFNREALRYLDQNPSITIEKFDRIVPNPRSPGTRSTIKSSFSTFLWVQINDLLNQINSSQDERKEYLLPGCSGSRKIS